MGRQNDTGQKGNFSLYGRDSVVGQAIPPLSRCCERARIEMSRAGRHIAPLGARWSDPYERNDRTARIRCRGRPAARSRRARAVLGPRDLPARAGRQRGGRNRPAAVCSADAVGPGAAAGCVRAHRPRQGGAHADYRGPRDRHGPCRPRGQSRHHRPVRHARVRPVTRERQARGTAEPDRPVRRRLLLGVHGRGPGRGDVPRGGVGRGLGLGVRGPRRLYVGAGSAGRGGHHDRHADEGGRGRVSRALQAGDHRPQMGRPHHGADHRHAGRQGHAGQRGDGAVAQAEGRHHGRTICGVLPPSWPYVRRAVGDAALAGGGRAGVHRPAVRAVLQAVRLHGRGTAR